MEERNRRWSTGSARCPLSGQVVQKGSDLQREEADDEYGTFSLQNSIAFVPIDL